MDAPDDFLRLFHPVQRRVGEDGVESGSEAEILAVHDKDGQAALPGGPKLGQARVDADDRATESGEFARQSAIPAAQIQDCFSAFGFE
jgi:hypothetical protein